MNEDEVLRDRLDLKDDPGVISPPVLAEPLFQCAVSISAVAFIPHAKIEIEVDGVVVVAAPGNFPEPNGQSFQLPDPLKAGQAVRARQQTASAISDWSEALAVRDHTQDYPAGPPRPEINPAPVYECGARTGVSNLLGGCEVWITADGAEVGRVSGAKPHQGVNVNPDYAFAQRVRAWASLCEDPSPPSEEHFAQHPPSPLPAPAIDPTYDGSEQIRVTGLVNGARFTLLRNGVDQGTFRTWGVAHLVDVSPPLAAGDSLRVSQRMCPGDPPSSDGTSTTSPCSALPAPKVGPVQAGDSAIVITEKVPGSRIQVYTGGQRSATAAAQSSPSPSPLSKCQ